MRSTPAADALAGVLLVDKPAGPTSHDVVDHIRRRFRIRKVGHGGTLDPQATGLLIILIGRATRLSGQFISSDKTYEGTILFGVTTNSYDLDGAILRQADASGLTPESVEAGMTKFRGDIFQAPPMVSAVKIKGVPLYKLARKGQEVPREPRLIHVYEFRLRTFAPPRATFILRCTKGTYVRSVCHELGQMLGCGACLEQLTRTQCGGYTLPAALPLDKIMTMDETQLAQVLIPIHEPVKAPSAP